MTDLLRPAARRVRAFFAPVERATGTPAVFDPAHDACFALDAPPAGWFDAGDLENFVRVPSTGIGAVRGGATGAVAAQYRALLEARVEFDFTRWGKLQMAIAGGSEHLNVLAAAENATPSPSGGTAAAAVALDPASTATELVIGAAAAQFAAGQMVAVDADYAAQTGYLGTGIAGACVGDASEIGAAPDYIRRVTFNVAKVADVTATSLLLETPLPGGVPAGAKAQKVIGFVDREGGRFFQEWSGLFVVPEEAGGRICFHYPRLQCAAPAAEMEEKVGPLTASSLHAMLRALPLADPCDSAQAVCWRTYYPAPDAPLY
jgi:hypothetical protein